ncbi:MAG: NUDIX hydrolase [Candidatus Magasanikbacteria bacterium GW2011_GWA2_45_39]|uniref:NUDIX hydrolase n=2 Tax=Candidatus Magasanikiibacteriota TaxID=1752731 RepID=A0A0G1QYG4_9BACT|nr:MAG: NUDIX hydrolase [Candidatus Magasanikbacteria bacterium GW2011_GWA2_45_39]KKU13710.1 MAG: NUDIX hydrolase [Candidatus Magasanikbacteria bacterium GW2011_GWC2_45_8]
MSDDIPQFGIKPELGYTERRCVYAIVFDDTDRLLVLKVNGVFHLPGGGIEADEDPETAVMREAEEEAGCEISDLQFLGKANQFFLKSDQCPLNKLGIFYRARLKQIDPSKGIEESHEVCWLTPEDFIRVPSGEFQKWAVKKSLLD